MLRCCLRFPQILVNQTFLKSFSIVGRIFFKLTGINTVERGHSLWLKLWVISLFRLRDHVKMRLLGCELCVKTGLISNHRPLLYFMILSAKYRSIRIWTNIQRWPLLLALLSSMMLEWSRMWFDLFHWRGLSFDLACRVWLTTTVIKEAHHLEPRAFRLHC